MPSNPKFTLPHEIVREAMKRQDLTLRLIATRLGERPDKLSIAVRGTSGVSRRSIELRHKVAELLSLDPYKVWDKDMMTVRSPTANNKKKKVTPVSELSEEQWNVMSGRERVRAMLTERKMTLRSLGEKLDNMPFSTVTKAIYGYPYEEARKKIAAFFMKEPHEIWPDLYSAQLAEDDPPRPESVDDLSPGLKTFLGFGNMNVRFSPL